jgi:hypothetical protein
VKPIRIFVVLLILALLLSSITTMGLYSIRAAELQMGAVPTVGTAEPLHGIGAAESPPLSAPSVVRQSPAGNWHIECVDCPKRFGEMADRNLLLDDEDHPHVAYGGDHLYYTWHDGTEWHYETVDESPVVGRHASLALDGAGWAHISYCDDINRSLKYAWRDGTGWHVETIDGVGYIDTAVYNGGYNSLALDSSGHSHISYFDDTNDLLKYAWRDGTGWHIETIDGVSQYGGHNSLALDGLDQPHVSYSDGNNGDLKYAWYDGMTWHVETVDSAGYYSLHNSLALDGSGHPHISYSSGGGLKYAWHDGVAWQVEAVDSAAGGKSSLALDGSGRPHISYHDPYGITYLKYTWYDGETWHIETVDSGGGGENSLALDKAGHSHISYYRDGEYSNGWLKHAWRDEAAWQSETVDSAGDTGLYTSLALDGSGQPHISYSDGYPGYSNHSLKYAWHDGMDWRIETVDSAEDVGLHTSLALDGSGWPHISYYGCGTTLLCDVGDLKYAWHDEAVWHIEVVDSVGWMGGYSSLALNESAQPHISYNDACNNDLKYAWHDGAGWHIETVDSEECVSGYTSLALDGSGQPHISYFNCNNRDLKYAWHDGMDWQIEIVDDNVGRENSPVTGGSKSSLALDGLERPRIGYFDHINGDLKYAWYDGTGWQIEVVDSEGWVGGYNSLALDGMDRPCISYYDYINDALKYAWHDGTGWQTKIVDSAGNVGGYTSLALDGSGRPHISYNDFTNGDLKYARLMPPLVLDKQAAPRDGLCNNDALTYALILSGPGLSVRLWDPLPSSVHYISSSITSAISPAAVYSPTAHAVVWQGALPTDTAQTIRLQVTLGITGTEAFSLSQPIVNTAWLTETMSGMGSSATVIVNGWHFHLPLVMRSG